jgi:hypothetical protein
VQLARGTGELVGYADARERSHTVSPISASASGESCRAFRAAVGGDRGSDFVDNGHTQYCIRLPVTKQGESTWRQRLYTRSVSCYNSVVEGCKKQNERDCKEAKPWSRTLYN